MKTAHQLKIDFDLDEFDEDKDPKSLKDLWEDITDWVWKNIGWRIRYFYRACKNLIRWFPIIWKDQDWDSSYIFEILKFKITNQARYIGGHDRHTTAKRDAEIMMTCVRLLDKVQDEFYDGEYMDYHKSDFRFEPCKDKPGYSEMHIDEISNRYPEYFAKYPRQYKRALDPNTKWYYSEKTDKTIAMWIGDENQKRAQNLLFKIMNENIRRWWD